MGSGAAEYVTPVGAATIETRGPVTDEADLRRELDRAGSSSGTFNLLASDSVRRARCRWAVASNRGSIRPDSADWEPVRGRQPQRGRAVQ